MIRSSFKILRKDRRKFKRVEKQFYYIMIKLINVIVNIYYFIIYIFDNKTKNLNVRYKKYYLLISSI